MEDLVLEIGGRPVGERVDLEGGVGEDVAGESEPEPAGASLDDGD